MTIDEKMSKKAVWIDEDNRIISFHQISNAEVIYDDEQAVWEKVLKLMKSGYCVQ